MPNHSALLGYWNRQTGALLGKLSLNTGPVSALAADEYRMLTGSDSSLRLWSLRDGQVQGLASGCERDLAGGDERDNACGFW